MECRRCDKELFLSLTLAQNAAQIYQWAYGKEYDPYECPHRRGDWHLTTERWRRRMLAEALRPTVTGQEQP